MKREIKFRGKRIDNGQWVVGSRIDRHGACYIAVSEFDLVKQDHEYEVDVNTVGQFTGVYDAYCTEIYEDDFVWYPECVAYEPTYSARPVYDMTTHQVIFDDGCFWLIAQDTAKNDPLPLHNMSGHHDPKVAGNIHDNPELLKQE